MSYPYNIFIHIRVNRNTSDEWDEKRRVSESQNLNPCVYLKGNIGETWSITAAAAADDDDDDKVHLTYHSY